MNLLRGHFICPGAEATRKQGASQAEFKCVVQLHGGSSGTDGTGEWGKLVRFGKLWMTTELLRDTCHSHKKVRPGSSGLSA